MTPQRKVEVNRRLAEFEGYIFARPRSTATGELMGEESFVTTEYGPKHAQPPHYTADLNALARLEEKLPARVWEISAFAIEVVVMLTPAGNDWTVWGKAAETTEAEARAEAICRYLESLK